MICHIQGDCRNSINPAATSCSFTLQVNEISYARRVSQPDGLDDSDSMKGPCIRVPSAVVRNWRLGLFREQVAALIRSYNLRNCPERVRLNTLLENTHGVQESKVYISGISSDSGKVSELRQTVLAASSARMMIFSAKNKDQSIERTEGGISFHCLTFPSCNILGTVLCASGKTLPTKRTDARIPSVPCPSHRSRSNHRDIFPQAMVFKGRRRRE